MIVEVITIFCFSVVILPLLLKAVFLLGEIDFKRKE